MLLAAAILLLAWSGNSFHTSKSKGFRKNNIIWTAPPGLIKETLDLSYFEEKIRSSLRSRDYDGIAKFMRENKTEVVEMYNCKRHFTNMVLNTLLAKRKKRDVCLIIDYIESSDVDIGRDTVHILIADAFAKFDQPEAEYLYKSYFVDGKLQPIERTLNIMMDGFRIARRKDKVLFYMDQFKEYDMKPDSYSYSSLLRTLDNRDDVKKLMDYLLVYEDLLSPTLIRCMMETAGTFGLLGYIFSAAERLEYNESIHNSSVSGDSFMLVSGQKYEKDIWLSYSS